MKGLVSSLFLDSGSFTLWTKAKKYAKERRCGEYDYYDTPEFWQYMDGYAEFVKTTPGIDVYANVDAIPHPRLTWRNQQYLEKEHGLTPVPVVHLGTDIKWLKHYVDRGYDYIAFGGMVRAETDGRRKWLNEMFSYLCDNANRTPTVKIHGFGLTAYADMIRYPWYSVDSTTWLKAAAYGELCVPRMSQGEFCYTDPNRIPLRITFSDKSPRQKKLANGGDAMHYKGLGIINKRTMNRWLDFVGIPLGDKTTEGVSNSGNCRMRANVRLFQEMVKILPPYPQQFITACKGGTSHPGFGVGFNR